MNCLEWTKTFVNIFKLDKHVFNVHAFPKPVKTKFYCERCPNSYHRLKTHNNIVHNHTLYDCNVCHNIFDTWYDLWRHKRRFHDNESLQPSDVQPSVQQRSVLNHICKHCCDTFVLKKDLIEHIRKNHPYCHECNVCNKKFNTEKGFSDHKRIHSISGDKIPCQHCTKLFYTRQLLQKHSRNVHSNKTYECDHCGKVYKSKDSLVKHLSIHHGNYKNKIKRDVNDNGNENSVFCKNCEL